MTQALPHKRARDRSPTEKVPRSFLEEIAFDEDLMVLQDVLDVSWVTNHDGRWERWYCDLEGVVSDLILACGKPLEELVPGLEKPYSVASEG